MIKELVKRLAPGPLLRAYRDYRSSQVRARFGKYPLQEAFRKIYLERLWGGDETFSGSGSASEVAEAYVAAIRRLIEERGVASVVDIGCGDFRIGRAIKAGSAISYCGVDIVPEIVARNAELFSAPDVRFVCADATRDELPRGDLCLVRQVLQHLSNEEIARALANLKRTYRLIAITEHQPVLARDSKPNLDKPHGPDTRLTDGSGVFVDRPPFNEAVSVLCEVPSGEPGGRIPERIVTVLVEQTEWPRRN